MVHVMLINDYRLISNLVAYSLEDEKDIDVVAACTPDDDIMQILKENQIDVVIISGQLSSVKAIDLVKQIDGQDHPTTVLILGMEDRKDQILPFIEAGISGYVVKEGTVEDLISAIHAAAKGRAHISPLIAKALMERVYKLAGEVEHVETSSLNGIQLTDREMEVLELISQNWTNIQIAKQLVVEVGTVKNHVHSILQKLDVRSRKEAANYLAVLRR